MRFSRKRLYRIFSVFAAMLLLVAVIPLQSREQSGGGERLFLGEIFTDAARMTALRLPSEVGVRRTRFVNIDFAPLQFAQSNPAQKYSLNLTLFPDVVFQADIEGIIENPSGSYSWIGNLAGIPESQFVLVVKDTIAVGNIILPHNFYQIRYAGNQIHAVNEVDQSQFPRELPPVPVDSIDMQIPDTAAADDGSLIDILVVYTGAARAGAGGQTAMNNLIDLAVTESNLGYANSDVLQRLNLVHTEEVVYDETGFNWSTTLSRLRGISDGYMDNVHTLRDTYGADEVALIVNDSGYCGIAYVMQTVSTGFEDWAFAVVARTCATGYYSFAHELGHNMGSAHDRANASVLGAYDYSFGYQAPDRAFRTIMAYNCPGGCTRVNYWSNPDKTYGGQPMGVVYTDANAADNRRSLNNTAYTVANFRQSVSVSYPLVLHGHDFTGNGMSSVSVWRPSNGRWYIKNSTWPFWGSNGDICASGDYNGDGTTDIAVWKPTNGRWYIKGQAWPFWGASGDVPVPGDYNGDTITDVAVWRPSTGQWYIKGQSWPILGSPSDYPVPQDYDGNGTTDAAVWTPATGTWTIQGQGTKYLGQNGDIPVPADYDGDGDAEAAVWRPSEGKWYIEGLAVQHWGQLGDVPCPGDFNGDGITDIAVWRPSNGRWYIKGQYWHYWGASGDMPLIR